MFRNRLTEFTFLRGRVGLYALLKALGVKKGDEVAIQSFSCIAVPEGVLAAGAKPIYIDIEKNGFNMDPEDLLRKINFRTKAIVIQHTYGIPAQIGRLCNIAKKNNIPVIESAMKLLYKVNMDTLWQYFVYSFHTTDIKRAIAFPPKIEQKTPLKRNISYSPLPSKQTKTVRKRTVKATTVHKKPNVKRSVLDFGK